MQKLVSYNQVITTWVNEQSKVISVVPWTHIRAVSFGAEPAAGYVAFTGNGYLSCSSADARTVARLLELILKGQSVEDVDFDSED